MAHFCPQCVVRVTPSMTVCPECGTRLPPSRTPEVGGERPTWGGSAPAVSPWEPRSEAGFRPAIPVGQPAAYDPLRPGASRYRKTPFWPRLVAWVIDGLLGAAATLPGIITFAIGLEGPHDGVMAAGLFLLLIGGVWSLWYAFTKDGPTGAGIGKRLMGLMVVHLPTNRPATRGQSSLRTLILCFTNVIPFFGAFIEPIVALTNDSGRRLGDRATDTQVITATDYLAS